MRRFGLVLALLLSLAALGVSTRAVQASCSGSCTGNQYWTTTIAGPATAVVGQQVTYTLTLTPTGAAGAVLCGPCGSVQIPAGATGISIAVTGYATTCGGATFAASPATFECNRMVFSAGGGLAFQPVVVTVTLTLGPSAVGAFTLQYADILAGPATLTTMVRTPVQLPQNTFTPASSVGLNFSGQAWDPRCEYGCPPNGLP